MLSMSAGITETDVLTKDSVKGYVALKTVMTWYALWV